MTTKYIRVLLIDDDEDYFFITRDLLTDVDGMAYQVEWVPNLKAAHQVVSTQTYDVCLVDYQLGQENGLDFVRMATQEGIGVPCILMTGQGNRGVDLEAMNQGAADYLNKGELSSTLLERTIRHTLERARHLTQLREYASDLEAKNRELDAYSYTIAHDLTNPLSLITGYISLVLTAEANNLSMDAVDMLKEVEQQTLRMSDMVTQLLWLARLHDTSELIGPVDIELVARSALSRFADRIQQQAVMVGIEPEMPPAMGQSIWAEEVFANLISNALKYMGSHNPKPQITIRGYRQGEFAVYEVEDSGIGIAPEDLNRLFEMFSRVRNKRTQDVQGLGLGLSIVHRIVSKLGGEVGVRSVPDSGSTFWFTLPTPNETSSA